MLKGCVEDLRAYSLDLMDEVWPGPTTITLPCKNHINKKLSFPIAENKRSLAFRVPNIDILIDVINEVGSPLLCTSANFSGEKPVSYINDVNPQLLEQADFVFTKNLYNGKIKKASTIIDCTGPIPKILRS